MAVTARPPEEKRLTNRARKAVAALRRWEARRDQAEVEAQTALARSAVPQGNPHRFTVTPVDPKEDSP